jgi:hypothetical protein
MPVFTIETPSGRRLKIEAGDEATAMRGAEEFEAGQVQQQQAPSPQMEAGMAELSRTTQRFADGGSLGGARAGAENFADTATFGLADEAAAGIGSIAGMLPGGHGKDYDSIKREIAAQRAQNDANHPIAAVGGAIAGALGGGLGMVRGGLSASGRLGANAGIGSRIGAGAADGAIYGGLYGAGSGEGVADRFKQGVGGAVAGGVIGGAIPAVTGTLNAVTKPVRDAVSARVNPSGFAARKITERLGASNMTPETVARRLEANPGSTMADVGGKSTRDLLRTTVNIPGPAKDRVTKQVNLRQFGQGDRLKRAIATTFADPDGYLSAKDQLAATAKRVASPLYERAYSRPMHFSETLEEVLNTPAGKRALGEAQNLAANEQQPFRQIFINIRGQAKRVPDTRGWDYIKRALDDMIDGQTDAITRKVTNEGRILVGLKNRMLAELDRYNPEYKMARKAFGGIAQIDEALEFGRKALTMSPESVRRQISGMSDTQKAAARIGAAETMRSTIDKTAPTHNAILKVFNSRERFQNLRSLFDNDQQFAEFRKSIWQEARKRSTYDAVKGNSTTASQLADMFEAGGTNEAMEFGTRAVTQGPINATLQWIGSRLARLGGLTPEVADQVATRLMSSSPESARMVIAELTKIERQQVTAAQKSQLVQRLLSQMLTSQSVGEFQQTR